MAAGRLLRALLLLTAGSAVLSYTLTRKEGENAEFPCNYPSSIQTPRVEWKLSSGTDASLIYYDGDLTAPYKTRADFFPQGLRLNSVTRKDSGDYVCEVAGKDSSNNPMYFVSKTTLVVLGSAVLPDTLTRKEGENAEFPCNYPSSIQTPRVEWKLSSGTDASLIYYDGDLTAPYKTRADFFPQGLRLNSVTRKDSSDYVCEVAGKDSSGNPLYFVSKTTLVVLGPDGLQ